MTDFGGTTGSSQEGSGPLTLITGADDNYAIGLAVTLHTSLKLLSPDVPTTVIVLDGGITSDSRTRLERVVKKARGSAELRWIESDRTRFSGLKTTKWGSTSNYLRLLIPEVVDSETDWAFYIDSDVMVRSDLEPLWRKRYENGSAGVLAVQDFHNRDLGAVFGSEGCKALNLDEGAPYFNSGVLLVNVRAWRDENVPHQCIEFVQNHERFMRHSDQDALNAILTGAWSPLDPKWNVMIASLRRFLSQTTDNRDESQNRRDELLRSGVVFHYTGPRKPWIPGYVGPAGREYLDVLNESGWFADEAERLRWHAGYWARTPVGWAKEGIRRARRNVGVRLRRLGLK